MDNNFIKLDRGIKHIGDDISWQITYEALQDHCGLKNLEGGLQCAIENAEFITAKAWELKLSDNAQSTCTVEITTADFS